MSAYYFRVMEDDKPNGYIGFVYAESKHDLFYVIDEFCDPYSVQIKKAHYGGYCRFLDFEKDEFDKEQNEFSEGEPLLEEGGWRDPKWEDFPYYYLGNK